LPSSLWTSAAGRPDLAGAFVDAYVAASGDRELPNAPALLPSPSLRARGDGGSAAELDGSPAIDSPLPGARGSTSRWPCAMPGGRRVSRDRVLRSERRSKAPSLLAPPRRPDSCTSAAT
jgi:hypothetical protein